MTWAVRWSSAWPSQRQGTPIFRGGRPGNGDGLGRPWAMDIRGWIGSLVIAAAAVSGCNDARPPVPETADVDAGSLPDGGPPPVIDAGPPPPRPDSGLPPAPDGGPVVIAEQAPPAISGGTLTMLRSGLAIAADPDRD